MRSIDDSEGLAPAGPSCFSARRREACGCSASSPARAASARADPVPAGGAGGAAPRGPLRLRLRRHPLHAADGARRPRRDRGAGPPAHPARASLVDRLRALRGRAEDGVLQLLSEVASSPLLRLLQLDRRVAALCIGWLTDDTAAVVLGREVGPGLPRTGSWSSSGWQCPCSPWRTRRRPTWPTRWGPASARVRRRSSPTSSEATATGNRPGAGDFTPHGEEPAGPPVPEGGGLLACGAGGPRRHLPPRRCPLNFVSRLVVRGHHSRVGSAAILTRRPSHADSSLPHSS